MFHSRIQRAGWLLAACIAFGLQGVHAQSVGTAFTYQGELRAAGAAANAPYDFQFRLFNSAGGNTQVGTTVTASAVSVINGLFTVPLDFGPTQFAGDAQWLEISVRPSNGGTFETLIPRTAVTPTPYALGAVAALANSVTTTSIVDGAVQSGDLAAGAVGTAQVNAAQVQRRVTGTCSGTQGVQSIAQDGTVVCGTFSGGGGTITQVTAGTGLTGGGTSGSVTLGIANGGVGTAQINAAQVQARVSGTCAAGQYVRVVNADGSVVCGSDANAGGTVTSIATGTGLTGGPVTGSGTIAVAAGGIGAAQINAAQVQARVAGSCAVGQYVRQVNQDGTVVCGTDAAGTAGWSLTGNAGTNPASNFVGTTDAQPFELRTANIRSLRIEPSSLTFGSPAVPITTNSIGGSSANSVTTGVRGATIAGGGVPAGNSDPGIGGDLSPNRVTDHYGTVGGGLANTAGNNTPSPVDAVFATVGGGSGNTADGAGGTVGGGSNNAAGSNNSTVGGGANNAASGADSTVAGGFSNSASGIQSTASGGAFNTSSGLTSTVGGGFSNIASGADSTVAGGIANLASGERSTVGGGANNEASATLATVSGGAFNCAGAEASWAGGFRAKVRPGSEPGPGSCALGSYPGGPGDQGTFVWADSQSSDFISTGPNQFLVRADGGFGFNTNTIPPGFEAVFQGRDTNVDLYLRTGAHARGISLAMLPTAGAAEFRIFQTDGASFIERLAIFSSGDFSVTAQAFKPGGGSWAVASDARLKADVAPLAGTLERLLALRGVSFAYRPELTPKALYLPGRQNGFIAQEVEAVFPEWVSETGDGYKTVGPRGFEALTVEALRELRAESATIDHGQNAEIAALRAENDRLRDEGAALRARLDAIEVRLGGVQ